MVSVVERCVFNKRVYNCGIKKEDLQVQSQLGGDYLKVTVS